MMDETKIDQLRQACRRIFALPITRSTMREIQNAIFNLTEGDKEANRIIFESLLTGEVKPEFTPNSSKESFAQFVDEFFVLARVAKDVLERGEFLSLITSDTMAQTNYPLYINRIRRIDGEEFQFLTDPETTVHLLQHFIGRMQELEKADNSKKIINGFKKELGSIKSKLEQLISVP